MHSSSGRAFPTTVFVSLLLTACGGAGDTGAPQPQPQPNPAPTLTSVAPDQLLLGQPATLTLEGTGFIAGSSVSWKNQTHAATYVNATTLTVSLAAADVAAIGDAPAMVVNPSPGGGTSAAVTVAIVSSIPVATSLSPTSTESGRPYDQPHVTITGSGFIQASLPVWDGQLELPVFERTSTSITAILLPTILAAGGAHQLSVKNKSVGGGRSNSLAFNVVNAVPSITALAPNPASTTGAFSLFVVGTGFMRNSVVRWNGADRVTTYDAGNLYAEIPAGDVVSVGAATITVYNPPPEGGTSAPATLPIRQAPLSVVGTIDLENSALVRDSTRDLLYASIPSGAGARQNTIVKIDPATAKIVGSLAVGFDPRRIAISDDDRFLYVALRGTPKIVRVDLATFTKDLEFDPGAPFGVTNGFGDELVVTPGAPKTVAVVVRNVGVVLFDDGVARTNGSATQGIGKGPSIVRGPDGSHVYGYNELTAGFPLYGNLVTTSGFTVETAKKDLLGGLIAKMAYDAGRIYATRGAVIDPVTLTVLGTYQFNFPEPAAVAPDARHGRVHFLRNDGISTYSTQDFTLLDSFETSLSGLTTITRWGADGLAAGGGLKIVILRGTLVAP